MRQYPLPLANAPVGQRRAFANGQFMLFRRDAYEAIGGHEAVKSALLEDLALAKRIEGAHRNGGVFFAAGLLHCRMYADWAQFRRGWKRIFTEAANRNARRLTVNAWRVRGLGTILPRWTLAHGWAGEVSRADPAWAHAAPREPDGPLEEVRLIPYGCTNIRTTEFPRVDG
jgi:hypothetical protein